MRRRRLLRLEGHELLDRLDGGEADALEEELAGECRAVELGGREDPVDDARGNAEAMLRLRDELGLAIEW